MDEHQEGSEDKSIGAGQKIIISDIVSLQLLIRAIQNALTEEGQATNSLYQFITGKFSVVNIKALAEQLKALLK